MILFNQSISITFTSQYNYVSSGRFWPIILLVFAGTDHHGTTTRPLFKLIKPDSDWQSLAAANEPATLYHSYSLPEYSSPGQPLVSCLHMIAQHHQQWKSPPHWILHSLILQMGETLRPRHDAPIQITKLNYGDDLTVLPDDRNLPTALIPHANQDFDSATPHCQYGSDSSSSHTCLHSPAFNGRELGAMKDLKSFIGGEHVLSRTRKTFQRTSKDHSKTIIQSLFFAHTFCMYLITLPAQNCTHANWLINTNHLN